MSTDGPSRTISVVIPVRDREAWIGRALESVLAQTRPADEVVVVDDGSSDGTLNAVRRAGGGVRLIEQASAGAAAARNRGVEQATSEWIAFLDSDDHWDAGHLERMDAALEATRGAAALYFADTRRPREEADALLWELARFGIEGAHELRADGTEWVMLPRQPMMLQSCLFLRSAYLEAGGLHAGLTRRHDTHLFFRMGLGKPLCAVAGVGAVMTNDAAEGRLTVALGDASRAYWSCTEQLYSEVLAAHPELESRHRHDLRRRLAHAHLRLAHFDLGEGHALRACTRVCRGLRLDPGRLPAALWRRVSR